MKNGYDIVSSILIKEDLFKSTGAKKQRQIIIDLQKQYRDETDTKNKRILSIKIRRAKSDLSLRPNRNYDHYQEAKLNTRAFVNSLDDIVRAIIKSKKTTKKKKKEDKKKPRG